jgi:cystathionine gamma-synthase
MQYQSLINKYTKQTGSSINILGIEDIDEKQTHQRTIIILETPSFPKCELLDIKYYGQVAKRIGAHLIVDSTYATPILCQPLSHGADFVIHATSLFMGGHSDITGGVIISQTAETAELIRKQRSVHGDVMGNLEAWLLLRSLKTLKVRVRQQTDTAEIVLKWLKNHRQIEQVWYASDERLVQEQLNGRTPGFVTFQIRSEHVAQKLIPSLQMILHASQIGGAETVLFQVAEREFCVGIGLEDVEDIINDLEQALA